MAKTRLSDDEIRQRCEELPSWSYEEGSLLRKLRFDDFVAAFAFMTRIALVAERMGHHPDWKNVYRDVEIRLSTHDVGGVSELDFELARAIDSAAG